MNEAGRGHHAVIITALALVAGNGLLADSDNPAGVRGLQFSARARCSYDPFRVSDVLAREWFENGRQIGVGVRIVFHMYVGIQSHTVTAQQTV